MSNERETSADAGSPDDSDAAGRARTEQGRGDDRRAPEAPAVRTGRGRGLAWFALLLASLALVGSGYFYYERMLLELPGTQATLRDLDQRIVALERPVAATAPLLDALREDFEQRLTVLSTALAARARSEVVAPAPPPGIPQTRTSRDWQLAEVRYLLRMANHRLLFERDVDSAGHLLRAADSTLQQLDDLALHPVRARIAEEVLALESLPTLDIQGLFLALEAIKRDIGRMPLRLPSLAPVDAEPAAAPDLWAALRAEFVRLVRFRRFEGAVRPLLAPEEGVYLELNLRLMLERTQLAALRREQTVYAESLVTMLDWIATYLDESAPEVRRVQAGLRSLQGVRLATPLPDISGSLAALDAVLRPDS
jgi:uroporphyrin-3 C-methyltransferase